MGLEFVETKVFTKRIVELGLEGKMQGLQQQLLTDPEAGDVENGKQDFCRAHGVRG